MTVSNLLSRLEHGPRALTAPLFVSLLLPGLAIAQDSYQCQVRPGPEIASAQPTSGNLPTEIGDLKATLVMEQNFDANPDWRSNRFEKCTNGTESACGNLPDGFDFMYLAERWNPSAAEHPNAQPSGQINGGVYRGASGKSYITHDESWGSSGDWGSDATLAHALDPAGYKDLYAEYWINFQTGYRWRSIERGAGLDTAKLARFTSFGGDSSDSRFSFLQGGSNTPIFLQDLQPYVTEPGRDRMVARGVVRCSPVSPNYYCGGYDDEPFGLIGEAGAQSFVQTFDDGAWHKIGMRARQNSRPGASDGIIQIWVDDGLWLEKTNVPFVGAGGSMTPGFNMFMIGGNMDNRPAPESEEFEQWVAFDDIRVFALEP